MIPPALLACLLAALSGAACAKKSGGLVALEARVTQLELMLAKREEALAFLDAAYEAKIDSETRPVSGKIYGVDIQPDVALGQVIGSPQALVTIVEAWDFA
jgi:hypothetical protein